MVHINCHYSQIGGTIVFEIRFFVTTEKSFYQNIISM